MKLVHACNDILEQLFDLVQALTDEDFSRPCNTLSGSTIGQHLRHTLEFFVCFERGCQSGIVNYDLRSHDKTIETDRRLAAESIERIKFFVGGLRGDEALRLEVNYDLDKESFEVLSTTVARELVYNIEHAVHHMAIIKIGVREIASYIKLPFNFGVAASTIRHQQPVLPTVG